VIVMVAGLSAAGLHCGLPAQSGPLGTVASPPQPASTPTGTDEVEVPGIALDADHTVGPPIVVDDLAVFPVYARTMDDLGDFVTLDAALERGTAVVHEVGADPGADNAADSVAMQQPQQPEPQAQAAPQARRAHPYRGGGAQVNTLVIENKGAVAILVLAGTVVKGGKQDRQIGQDFVVGAKETVPVDAFCVEHGRWEAVRNGQATGGSFKSLKTLAVGEVRAAGQYEQNQGAVWSKVGEINRATGKQTASDTLTASLEDADATAQRDALGAKVLAWIRSVPVPGHVVGLAYAVGGEVQGARWFFHHKLFEQYAETLVSTAVAESFTARSVAKAKGQAPAEGACAPELVARFVGDADRGRQEQRSTAGKNVNTYEFSDDVYAAEAEMKDAAPIAGAPPAKKRAVTKDFLRKK
jgi:hypothetical protein